MTRQAISTDRRPGAPSGRTARASTPTGSCSAAASSASTRRPASSSRAVSRRRPSARCATSARCSTPRALTWADVLKTTIFLADIGRLRAVNAVYGTYMPDPPPARSTVAVGALPKGGLVEIEAIARRSTR